MRTHIFPYCVIPTFSNFLKSACKRESCSCVYVHIRMTFIRQTTPSKPSETSVAILFWKCSSADAITNGSLLKKYIPTSLIKVAILTSSVLNILASVNDLNVYSVDSRMYFSLDTDLSWVRLTRMRSCPDFFTTTIQWLRNTADNAQSIHVLQFLLMEGLLDVVSWLKIVSYQVGVCVTRCFTQQRPLLSFRIPVFECIQLNAVDTWHQHQFSDGRSAS